MDLYYKEMIWNQFGAAIDMLENAINACPENVWSDRSKKTEFWYTAYHTIFWLDFYLSESGEDFIPPAPFDLKELDPAGLLPDRVYTKDEILNYLNLCRQKVKTLISSLTDEEVKKECSFGWITLSKGEFILYNMRHVQHHAAQLNLILRQEIDSAPKWVRQSRIVLPN